MAGKNIFIVHAHPEPRSLNGALKDLAVRTLSEAGHHVEVSDLYAMGWKAAADGADFPRRDPAERLHYGRASRAAFDAGTQAQEVRAEQDKLRRADAVILQFPLWWFSVPAILKGWVDRVFAMGRAYGHGQVYADGRFRGKRAMVSVTTGGPSEAYAPDGFNGAIEGILRPIQRGIFQFVGFQVLAPHVLYGPARVEPAVRAQWLGDWQRRLRDIAREAPVEVGTY